VEVRSSDQLGTRLQPEATEGTTAKNTPSRLACGAHWFDPASGVEAGSVAVPSVWLTTTPLICDDAPTLRAGTTRGRWICGVGVQGLSNICTRREAAPIVVVVVRVAASRGEAALAFRLAVSWRVRVS
jgi:hypothetical protein